MFVGKYLFTPSVEGYIENVQFVLNVRREYKLLNVSNANDNLMRIFHDINIFFSFPTLFTRI